MSRECIHSDPNPKAAEKCFVSHSFSLGDSLLLHCIKYKVTDISQTKSYHIHLNIIHLNMKEKEHINLVTIGHVDSGMFFVFYTAFVPCLAHLLQQFLLMLASNNVCR